MQDEETYFRLKKISKYEMIPYAELETRKAIMNKVLKSRPKAVVKGRLALMNRWHESDQSLQRSL